MQSKMSSFVQDTRDSINKIEGFKFPLGATLLTLDVTSWNTQIPFDEAKLVLENVLSTRSNMSPPTYFLLELIILFEENIILNVMENLLANKLSSNAKSIHPKHCQWQH